MTALRRGSRSLATGDVETRSFVSGMARRRKVHPAQTGQRAPGRDLRAAVAERIDTGAPGPRCSAAKGRRLDVLAVKGRLPAGSVEDGAGAVDGEVVLGCGVFPGGQRGRGQRWDRVVPAGVHDVAEGERPARVE